MIVLVAAANAVVLIGADKYICDPEETLDFGADCILVPGALVYGDTPSQILRERLDTACDLYFAGAAPKLLMSGDHGQDGYDELHAMKQYAIDRGVPPEDIFCDHAGFNTYNSLARAQKVFGCEKVIVVTQGFHLSRAVFLGNALGLGVRGVKSDLSRYKFMNYVRESLARVKAVWDSVLLPEPRYLGEAIPISGDGGVTDDKPYELREVQDK